MKATPVARRLAHVAEHHRLHVDGGAPFGGNVVEPAIGDRARVHPGREHRADRAPELVLGVLRERLARQLRDLRLVVDDDLAPIVGGKVGVERLALAILELLEDLLEIVALDLQHDVRIHLDEAAIAVVGETLVARGLGQRQHGLVVEAEIEHRIHHPGHRRPGPRTHGDQQRIAGVAEPAPGLPPDAGERRFDLGRQFRGIGLFVA